MDLVKSDGRTGTINFYAPGIEMSYEHINNNEKYCDECKMINTMCIALCNDYHRSSEYNKWVDLFVRHDPKTHITAPPTTTHKGNGVHQGLFAGTLTMAPTDAYNEEDMVGAITKIFAQQTVPVKKWAWYREYTKNGTPHIHFVYETESGGRIHKKIFQRYWKLWDEPRNQTGKGGFPGGFHSPVKSETAYIEYISKDSGRSKFKGFTLQNEILQIDQ